MAAFVGQTPNGACLFVKGLAKGVNEKHLSLFFGSFGSLLLCQLARHRSGRSAGFAIISFGSCHDAQTALLRTDKAFFLGRQLIVRWFQPDFDGPKLDSGAFLFQTRPQAPPPPHGATPHTGVLSSQRAMRNAYSDPGTAADTDADDQQWYALGGQQQQPSAQSSSAAVGSSAMPQQQRPGAGVAAPAWPVDSGFKLCTWREEDETDLRPLLPSLLLEDGARHFHQQRQPAADGHLSSSFGQRNVDVAGPLAAALDARMSLFGELGSAGSLDYMLDIAQADFAALDMSSGGGGCGGAPSSLLGSSADSLCGSRLLKWGVLNSSGGGGSLSSSASSSLTSHSMRRSRSLEGSDIIVTASAVPPYGCADHEYNNHVPPPAKSAAPVDAKSSADAFLNLPDEFPLSLNLCFQPPSSEQLSNSTFAAHSHASPVQQRTRAAVGGCGAAAAAASANLPPAHPCHSAQAGSCYSSPSKPPLVRSGLAHHAPAFVPRASAQAAAGAHASSSKHQAPGGGGFDAQAMLAKQMPPGIGFDASMMQAMGAPIGPSAGTANPFLPWALNPYAAAALQQYALAQFVSSQQNMAMAAAALGQMGGGGAAGGGVGGNSWMPDATSAFAAGGGAWFPPSGAVNGLNML